jgi:hypothetical protein
MSPFLIVSLVLFLVWAVLFLASRSTRREQAIMSLIGLILSPGALFWAATDYRSGGAGVSSLGIEDILFSFALFGIAAVIYQVLFGKHVSNWRGERYRIGNPAMHWISHLILTFGIWAFIALTTALVFHLSSVQAFILGGLIIGVYIIADRKDLMLDALLSGLFVAMLVFIIEQLFFMRLFPVAAIMFWRQDSLSGIILGGIPIEEILWAAIVGFAIGPFYEYVRRYKLI